MRFKTFLLFITLLLTAATSVLAQNVIAKATDVTDVKDKKADDVKKVALTKAETDGLRIAESSILVYSGLRGRQGIGQVRKTTVEVGKLKLTAADGKKTKADYERRILRGDNLEKEKVRVDQKSAGAGYALVYDGEKIFGLFNNVVFSPREDATKAFEDYIWHGLGALLRYRENGSKVVLEKEEKILGVDLYVVRVTDKANRVTTFYASKKSLRVMMLKYESEGVKYRRKFYNHNYAQGTLVPYRSVLWADDKQIEEKEIATITFGQTVSEGLFKGPPTP